MSYICHWILLFLQKIFFKLFVMDKKLAIIGCGNIGLSLLQGLLKDKTILAGILMNCRI